MKTTISPSPVTLITGALSGIGRASALAFAKTGARIVVSGRHEDAGRQFSEELKHLGAEAEFVRADVRKEDDVRRLVDATVDRFERLDIAINNAGTEGKAGPITEVTPEIYAEIFDTNVLGVMLSLKHELRVMIPQGSGSIVNISSTLGLKGMGNYSVYAASKHAVQGLTKSVALEAAKAGVRVNVIAPGPTDTPMFSRFVSNAELKQGISNAIPLQRIGHPDEVARAIVFLASESGSFITGATLGVDGGLLA